MHIIKTNPIESKNIKYIMFQVYVINIRLVKFLYHWIKNYLINIIKLIPSKLII